MCTARARFHPVKIDTHIASQGDKLALTATAEGQARSGDDILQLSDWYAAAQADNLEPVDDLVTA
jgi:hypothetical protein